MNSLAIEDKAPPRARNVESRTGLENPALFDGCTGLAQHSPCGWTGNQSGLRYRTAALFGVSVATAVRWSQRKRRTGEVTPGKVGGHRKLILLSEREWLLARLEVRPDATLRGLVTELDERGVRASYGALWRLLRHEGMSVKRNAVRRRTGPTSDPASPGAVEEISGAAWGMSDPLCKRCFGH